LYIIASVFSAALAMEFDDGEEKGLCLDPKMMAAMCTYNSAIGDKMTVAHDNCAAESRKSRGHGKGKGKGRNSNNGNEETCGIDFGKIEEFFEDVWENKACILREVGWLDAEDNLHMDQLEEDIASLPGALAQGLSDTHDLCFNRTSDVTLEGLFSSDEFGESIEMGDGSEVEECTPQVNPEQLLAIELNLQKLAFFRCVHENFMNGCGNYILEVAQQMMMEQGVTTPAPAL